MLLRWAAEILQTGGSAPLPLGRDEPLVARVRLLQQLREGYVRLLETRGEEVQVLGGRIRSYASELHRLGVSPAEVHVPMETGRAAFFVLRELELIVVGLPIALWGLLNHLLPFVLLRTISRRLSRDPDHWASNVVIPSLVVIPACYALQAGIASTILPWGSALIYVAVLPYAGLFFLLYRDRAGGAIVRARTFLRFLFAPSLRRRLADEGTDIIESLRALDSEPGG